MNEDLIGDNSDHFGETQEKPDQFNFMLQTNVINPSEIKNISNFTSNDEFGFLHFINKRSINSEDSKKDLSYDSLEEEQKTSKSTSLQVQESFLVLKPSMMENLTPNQLNEIFNSSTQDGLLFAKKQIMNRQHKALDNSEYDSRMLVDLSQSYNNFHQKLGNVDIDTKQKELNEISENGQKFLLESKVTKENKKYIEIFKNSLKLISAVSSAVAMQEILSKDFYGIDSLGEVISPYSLLKIAMLVNNMSFAYFVASKDLQRSYDVISKCNFAKYKNFLACAALSSLAISTMPVFQLWNSYQDDSYNQFNIIDADVSLLAFITAPFLLSQLAKNMDTAYLIISKPHILESRNFLATIFCTLFSLCALPGNYCIYYAATENLARNISDDSNNIGNFEALFAIYACFSSFSLFFNHLCKFSSVINYKSSYNKNLAIHSELLPSYMTESSYKEEISILPARYSGEEQEKFLLQKKIFAAISSFSESLLFNLSYALTGLKLLDNKNLSSFLQYLICSTSIFVNSLYDAILHLKKIKKLLNK